ncbi:MAG: flippase-like domain-containing protein [Paenibacillaceae bacterium]|nr:flippase-like domain-containing protein [Paenibacillaceae bacterium]
MTLFRRQVVPVLGGLLLIGFLYMTWRLFDFAELKKHLLLLVAHPQWLLLMAAAYWGAFVLKAAAWRLYDGSGAPFRIYYHGIIYSLLVNHLLPLKAGDIARVGFLMQRGRRTWDEALHSVGAMRLLDMLILAAFAGVGIVQLGLSASWLWLAVLAAAVLALAAGYRLPALSRLSFLRKHLSHAHGVLLSPSGAAIALLVAASWLLEAGVLYGVMRALSLHLPAGWLVWANSMTIAGQVFHVTPGGIGTYESALSGTLVWLGIDWKTAYAAAVMSHLFKFAFAYVAGAVTWVRMPVRRSDWRAWMGRSRRNAKRPTESVVATSQQQPVDSVDIVSSFSSSAVDSLDCGDRLQTENVDIVGGVDSFRDQNGSNVGDVDGSGDIFRKMFTEMAAGDVDTVDNVDNSRVDSSTLLTGAPDLRTIVVFLPAHNEADNIAAVIARIPRFFHPDFHVKVLVIDDGSRDATAELAWEAGADRVVSFPRNRGLGAAVREGLAECCRMGADAGLMIDADNEYPPEQIPDVLAPILSGAADYTFGSRFKGRIRGMKLHRRLGNYAFTLLQVLLLRKWISDGQSGMRGFSREAMDRAEINHDYNYAQVLTINLLRQGFRLAEVPIDYQVRTKGQSFIKFRQYVTSVLPAIYREMRRRPVRRRKP